MKKVKYSLSCLKLIQIVLTQVLLLFPLISFGQSYFVGISSVIVVGPYSSHLSDYVSNPSKIVIAVQKFAGGPDINVKLFASLIGDNGIQITTNPSALSVLNPISLTSVQPAHVVNALFIRNVFDLSNVSVVGITATSLQTNGLPPGNYQLCVQAVTADSNPLTGQQAGVPASDQNCGNSFNIPLPSASVSILNVQLIPPYSYRLSDMLNNPAKVAITLQSNVTYPLYKIKLLASLKGDNGVRIVTNPAALTLLPEITLQNGLRTIVLNATSISNLFNLEGVTYQGISYNQLVNGNGLPEGTYELCVTPVTAETDPATQQQAGQPLSDEKCSNPYVVTNLEPPVIINPLSGIDIESKGPQNVLINWSIPPGVKGAIQYDLRMVEIRDSLKDVNDAVQSATDPAFFEKTILNNVLLYGPGEPTLTPGNRYAFFVTASDPTNSVVFRNGGRSEVAYFTYKPSSNNISQVPPDTSKQGNSQSKNINKQDTSSNPISIMDAPDLDCSCKTTISDKSVNNSNATSGTIVHVGAFDMTLGIDVKEKSGLLSGSGTIPVPFINSSLLKIRVEYSDLQVNASGQAIAGTVRAKRNGNAASIMPVVDMPKVKPQPFNSKDILNVGSYVSNSVNNAIVDSKNAVNSAGWEMPFGIEKEISGEKITIAITDMVFTPEQAGFNACLAFDVPEGGGKNTLALGAKNICFKDSKNLCGDAILFLVEDFKIDALNLTFIKASGSKGTQAGTYAIFDPNGFKQLHIKAEYEFSQDVIQKQSDKGAVKATFETDIKSWNNWYASVSIDPFFVAGYEEWKFSLKSPAYYDHSDSMNAPGMPTSAIESKTNHLDKSWMGFYFSDLDASLPAVLKRADKKPISIGIKNFMIDKQGITGDIAATDVIAASDGDLDGWYYSLDSIYVRFVNTSFIKGGMNGKVLLPISGSPAKNSQDELDYNCTLSKPASPDSSMKFQFVIKPKNNIQASLWAATLNLLNTSSIIVNNQKSKDNPAGDFRATATLNGDISISADLSPIPKINFKAVEFQDFQLMTYKPYVSGKFSFFGFSSPDKSAGGFPVKISDISPVFNGGTVGISFNLNISLADVAALPEATFKLAVVGDLTMTGGRPNWGNPHLEVDSISIKGPLGPLDINGYVKFFDQDATYGNGVKGALEAKLDMGVNKVDITSHIMFGHTSFNYFYVDLSFLMTIGTPIVPPVSLFGLGGGVYYNMSKAQDISPDALLKGTSNDLNRYKPTNGIIGFKASIVVGVGNGTPFHAMGTFSMEFTSDFGVKSVDLDIDAAMMCELTADISSAPINGHGHIGYDFSQKIFDAGVGLNVNFKAITGSGWLALNINGQNGDWYFKLGEPSNRVNVNILSIVTLNAYFMMGNKIPGIPDPPSNILADFPSYKSSRDNTLVSNQLLPGFAFGSALNFGPVDLTFLIFYMHFSAGMGFDINLRQYTQGCDGSSNLPGINGWYANGQFYAWVDFSFGIQVDVWFYKGKIDIAKLEAAALFQAGAINPIWFDGWLYGHFEVLDGLISGTMHFQVSVGDKCVPVGNPLGSDLPIIADINPIDNEKDISIARNPVAAFNFPVNYDFDVKNTTKDGTEVFNTIHIDLTEFTIRRKSDNGVVADMTNNQNLSFTEEMKLATLYTKEAFDPQGEYTVTVSVKAYDQYHQPLTYNSKPVEETMTHSFKAGDCLHRLDENAQMMLGSYPFKNQRYFLPKEQSTGFIQLDKNYPCLLNDPNYDLIAQFVSYSAPGKFTTQESPVGQDGDQLTYQIPALPNEEYTQLRIIKRRKVNKFVIQSKVGLSYSANNKYLTLAKDTNINTMSIKNASISGASESGGSKDLELYNYYFKTSKYNTLAQKIMDCDNAANATRDGFGNFEGYTAVFHCAEGFDTYDVNETTFTAFGDKFVIYPLVNISEQAPGNAWIQNYVAGYLYSSWKMAYIYGSDYKDDISPYTLRKAATGLQCLIFEPSLNPVGILPISAEPPLSQEEINTATDKFANSMHSSFIHF